MEEKIISPTRSHWFALQANKWFSTCLASLIFECLRPLWSICLDTSLQSKSQCGFLSRSTLSLPEWQRPTSFCQWLWQQPFPPWRHGAQTWPRRNGLHLESPQDHKDQLLWHICWKQCKKRMLTKNNLNVRIGENFNHLMQGQAREYGPLHFHAAHTRPALQTCKDH